MGCRTMYNIVSPAKGTALPSQNTQKCNKKLFEAANMHFACICSYLQWCKGANQASFSMIKNLKSDTT